MVEPIRFGSGAGLAAGAASGPVQRRLRKMSAHPEEPRVFSQAKILISTGLPLSLITTVIMPTPIYDYVTGVSDDIFSIIVPGFITAMSYIFLLHGLFRRFGVVRIKSGRALASCSTVRFGSKKSIDSMSESSGISSTRGRPKSILTTTASTTRWSIFGCSKSSSTGDSSSRTLT